VATGHLLSRNDAATVRPGRPRGWLGDLGTGVHVPMEVLRVLIVPKIREHSRGAVFGEDLGRDGPDDSKQVGE
jgi:hypothetical protein